MSEIELVEAPTLGADDVLVTVDIAQHTPSKTEITASVVTADEVKLSAVEALLQLFAHLGGALLQAGVDVASVSFDDVEITVE